MGINICVETSDFEDHPAWDSGRFAGDKEMSAVMFDLPATVNPKRDEQFRPSDFAAWRAALMNPHNPQRPGEMLDILEKQPDYWIRISR